MVFLDENRPRFPREAVLLPGCDDDFEEPNAFEALFLSFGMILMAEFADKTFFVACILAMKYSRVLVFMGCWLGLVCMTGISVALAMIFEHSVIPQNYVQYAAGALFAIFGLQMFYEGYKNRGLKASDEMKDAADELSEGGNDDSSITVRFRKSSTSEDPNDPEVSVEMISNSRRPSQAASQTSDTANQNVGCLKKTENTLGICVNKVFLKAFLLTFLGEWGDKSQLGTISLAATNPSAQLMVFIGCSLGYAACVGLAVILGKFVVSKIKITYLNIAGGILFLGFSAFTFYNAFMHPEDDTVSDLHDTECN
ncbi:Oidioi.mRNA.OKI2018_I69.chr1.g758.t1.cds [Oikopleura dioica]|uniref:GDT1 family protein n=1 Tax=Oikopleura dioica TaxID=34765 RepID=A0ABN7SMK0_OIKDI|nr:Oidioi.mRNA.OKI2018_I69.chr1.g758.t1.cds [Oikopleura dioica]